MNIEALVWEMKNGKIISLKYDNRIFYFNGFKIDKLMAGRKPIFLDWIIQQKGIIDMKEFFRTHKYQRNHPEGTTHIISKLIENGNLLQLDNDKFKIVKEIK